MYQFRTIIGTSPEQAIEKPEELLPTQKILDDPDNIDLTTELHKIQPYRLSNELMAYLRSVLTNNFTSPEAKYVMISCPRVLSYEKLVFDWAIKLLTHVQVTNCN